MDELLNEHIGRRLKARRRALRLSQSELGAMTGIRFRQIHKYETGENRTSAAILWKLACALRVGVQHFYEGWTEGLPAASFAPAANDLCDLPRYVARPREGLRPSLP